MRKYYIDNLRWLTVLLLFPYHTFMIYNTFGESFYIKGMDVTGTSAVITAIWPWIMPLMFVIAGISSAYALQRRTAKEYFKERFHKLFLPLVFGILLLMPIITYFAECFHNGFSGSYFDQYVLFFTKPTDLSGYNGGFTPGHLWFILYLFIISLLALPIMVKFKKLPVERLNIVWLITLFILPLLLRPVLDISGKSIGEYFAYFMLGYFVFSNETVVNTLDRYRFLLTGLFLGGMVVIVALFLIRPEVDPFVYDGISGLYGFSGVLALLGLSRHYLNFHNKVAHYLGQSSFSVYVFHQIWIVVVAYFVFGFVQSVVLQILLILLFSIILTFLTHELFKRNPVTRFLFAIQYKPKDHGSVQ